MVVKLILFIAWKISILLFSCFNFWHCKLKEIFLIVKSCRFPIVFVNSIRYNPPNSAIYYNCKWKAIVIGHNCACYSTTYQKGYLTLHYWLQSFVHINYTFLLMYALGYNELTYDFICIIFLAPLDEWQFQTMKNWNILKH